MFSMKLVLPSLLAILLSTSGAFAQDTKASSASKSAYKTHKVAPKENWYSIGRAYGLGPRDIAAFNNLTIDKGLKIGQVLSIPLGQVTPAAPLVVATPPTSSPTKAQDAPSASVQPTSKPAALSTQVASSSGSNRPVTANNTPVEKPAGIGYFAPVFEQQAKEGKVQKLDSPVYGIFKSTSGWQDSKYYVLLNSVVPGTVVKLRVPHSDKLIYAKVLGAVPPGKESEGVDLRMSNAAASALGLAETGIGGFEVLWYN